MIARAFEEFAGNKRLLWIAEEWERYADKLAEWAMERIVNRRDVWSQYTVRNGEVGVVMLPTRDKRVKGAEMVTMNKLRRHFSGHAPQHLIGLFSISDHSTCKWFAIDIDLHDESVANADEVAANNFTAALTWAERLREQGMDPLLIDSNGVGGYHLWTLLDREYPLADTFDFGDQLRSEWEELGLPRRPEMFPPKRAVGPDDLPYTLRLPGRHHRRLHYSRVWNFDALGENEWLEGGEAIEAMLAIVPSQLPTIETKDQPDSKPKKRKQTPKKAASATKQKPTVCVDLDGVLAEYDGWEGVDVIGKPISGAKEFMEKLSDLAEVVIFTSRCAPDAEVEWGPSKLTPGQARINVIEWLEKHEIPYSDVFMGEGKPHASAFIDDRGVACRPQVEKKAFTEALSATRSLLKRKKHA